MVLQNTTIRVLKNGKPVASVYGTMEDALRCVLTHITVNIGDTLEFTEEIVEEEI